MPRLLARGLHQIAKIGGHEVSALRDVFEPDISDIDYFDELGSSGDWVVISKDLSNAKKRAEREAILRNNIVALYLSSALQKKHVTKQAATILWQWESIINLRIENQRGLFKLPENKGLLRPL